ncbi:MAG: 4-hydroxy-tetrahydrodipicolinate reductase [Salibacteraceae bacterium]
MKIAIIGYGKMGKTIENLSSKFGHQVTARINSTSGREEWEKVSRADVAIEFTQPDAAFDNIARCLEMGVSVVCGTTGWYHRLQEIKPLLNESNSALFYASNFSIGVQIFWQVNKYLARLMANHPDYKVYLSEIHHTEKKDKPSGTAVTTAEQIISTHPGYEGWHLTEEKLSQNSIPINALRKDDVKGIHEVKYDSAIDCITIGHEAKSRDGFANGAIRAAEFIMGKTGIYTMDDLMGWE